LIRVTFSNILYDNELEFAEPVKGNVTVSVEGHAVHDCSDPGHGYDSSRGENIICAAVSFAASNLFRSLKIVGNIEPEYSMDEGMIRLTVALPGLDPERKRVLKVLLESFIIGMLDLKEQYKDIIALNFND
jgi:uncharacterized protein YsxB (DUF464 family)